MGLDIKMPWEGLLTTVADRAGSIIDQLVRDKDLAEQLKHQLSAQELSQDHSVQMAQIQADQAVEIEVQRTAQIEQQQTDKYTKRTRPKLARKSFNLAAAYALWSIIDGFVIHLFTWFGEDRWEMSADQVTALMAQTQSLQVDFNPAIFLGLASPVLAYMGIRGLEKSMGYFKQGTPQ